MSERNRTKRQIAKALGVSIRTVNRWVARGCPAEKTGYSIRFSEEEVRGWQAREGITGRIGRPSFADALPSRPAASPASSPGQTSVASKQNLAKAELARKISMAKKTELEVTSERSLKDLGLDEKIREARTPDDMARLNQEIAGLVGSGALLPARGHAIQRLLAEARQNMLLAQQQAETEKTDERVILCTEDGGAILRVFEGIVSDARRNAVARFVKEQGEADLLENPDVDTLAEPAA